VLNWGEEKNLPVQGDSFRYLFQFKDESKLENGNKTSNINSKAKRKNY